MVANEENIVHVGGLPWETDACELEAAFSSFGSIIETKIMVEKNGRSGGFGFVTFSDRSEAYDAITRMDGRMLGRRYVSVKVARHTFEEPSYASFSCRGPYGEVDLSMDDDVCFSCKGLGKLHDWPALGGKTGVGKLSPASAEETSIVHGDGASESSYAASDSSLTLSSSDVDEEETPEKFSDSNSENRVESKVLVEDPGHLSSVISTLSPLGCYTGRDGHVGEGDCSVCGCPLHWACNCFLVGGDVNDDSSDVVSQEDDSDSSSVVQHEDGSVSLTSKVDLKAVVLDPVSLFEGVHDCSALAKVFKLRPSTFLRVPNELSPRFRCLVLNEFSLFLSDLGNKIDVQSLNEERFCNLLLTLGDLRNNKLEVDWLEERLRAMHAISEVTRANARLEELEAELVDVQRRVKEIEVEKRNVKTTIDKHSEHFSQHSFDIYGSVAQDLV